MRSPYFNCMSSLRIHFGFSLLLLIVVLLLKVSNLAAGDKEHLDQYLYLSAANPDDVYPIQEELAKESNNDVVPDFLKDTYPKHRIVEFYAHWCPHCQHFKPKYIKFARELQEYMQQERHLVDDFGDINTFAVSCVPHQKICSDFQIHGYPTVKVYPANSLNGTALLTWHMDTPKVFFKNFGAILKQNNNNNSNNLVSSSSYKNNDENNRYRTEKRLSSESHSGNSNSYTKSPYFMRRSKYEIFQDAHSSLLFLLEHNIFVSSNNLTSEQKKILKDFLIILQISLPSNCSMQLLLQSLLKDFFSSDNTIIGKEKEEELWISTLRKNEEARTTTIPKKWSDACSQHGTGFTCGLWTLFHISSVGLIFRMSEWNDNISNQDLSISPGKVADTLRGFIEHFFRCEVCVENFLFDYDSCNYDRCNRLVYDKNTLKVKKWKEYILWLYELHNGVNTRLRKERMEENNDHEENTTPLEVLWPPIEECDSCWIYDDRWDEDAIYSWLCSYYWPQRDDLKQHPSNEKRKLLITEMEENKNKNKDINNRMSFKGQRNIIIFLLFIGGGTFVWIKKRRFHRKGYHKKR